MGRWVMRKLVIALILVVLLTLATAVPAFANGPTGHALVPVCDFGSPAIGAGGDNNPVCGDVP